MIILEALAEIPSLSKFFLMTDMQLDVTDCAKDEFCLFLELSVDSVYVAEELDSL